MSGSQICEHGAARQKPSGCGSTIRLRYVNWSFLRKMVGAQDRGRAQLRRRPPSPAKRKSWWSLPKRSGRVLCLRQGGRIHGSPNESPKPPIISVILHRVTIDYKRLPVANIAALTVQ